MPEGLLSTGVHLREQTRSWLLACICIRSFVPCAHLCIQARHCGLAGAWVAIEAHVGIPGVDVALALLVQGNLQCSRQTGLCITE